MFTHEKISPEKAEERSIYRYDFCLLDCFNVCYIRYQIQKTIPIDGELF